jgi:WD40 repeat protein
VSSSKDALVKIWDIDSQHCVQTLVGHRAEVWSVAVDASERRLVTGSTDGLLRVWDIEPLWNRDAPKRTPVRTFSLSRSPAVWRADVRTRV